MYGRIYIPTVQRPKRGLWRLLEGQPRMENSTLPWVLDYMVSDRQVDSPWATHLNTKLKRIRPPIPRKEPNQSILSDSVTGFSVGRMRARLPNTTHPRRALIPVKFLGFKLCIRLHKDEQPFPRRQFGQKPCEEGTQPTTYRSSSTKKA